MSDSSTPSGSSATLEVNTIALIVGISVVATILLVVSIVALCIWCRNLMKRRKKDRSRLYMVHDGASPYSSVNGPPSGGLPSYNAGGYENKAMDVGEFRPNPIAENPFYPSNTGVSMLNIPSQDFHGVDPRRFNNTRLAVSTQSLDMSGGYGSQSFHRSLYDKLVDTIHQHKGRPLYLCKREDYFTIRDYFDIIGKTRMGDWLVRPRSKIPNRPKPKSNSKKTKAPKPPHNQNGNNLNFEPQIKHSNGFTSMTRPGSSGVITTPFGAGERMPQRYLSGSHLDTQSNVNYEPRYTSLPREKLYSSGLNGHMVKRQTSLGAGDSAFRNVETQQRIDEHMYAQVMKKNSLNSEEPRTLERKNPNRRAFTTIDESENEAPKTPKVPQKSPDIVPDAPYRDRSGSASTVKSLGITDQFRFLEQYDTEEERF